LLSVTLDILDICSTHSSIFENEMTSFIRSVLLFHLTLLSETMLAKLHELQGSNQHHPVMMCLS